MSGYNSEERVLLSMPHLVRWDGFSATTIQLQRMGWELSAEHISWDMSVRLAMRNQDHQLIAITNTVRAMHLHQLASHRHIRGDVGHVLTFDIVRMASMRAMEEYGRHNPYGGFKPIDAYPQFHSMDEIVRHTGNINDLIVFAPCMAETQELIVDEAEVSSILAKLIEAQKPENERIRERNRLRESREGLELGGEPRRKFHAQILSIAA